MQRCRIVLLVIDSSAPNCYPSRLSQSARSRGGENYSSGLAELRGLLHDGLGSMRGMFDGTLQSAAEYDPFGEPIVAPSDTAYGFTGRQIDGSGLIYLRGRYTSPKPER